MDLKRRLAAFGAVSVALAGAPVALASAATIPVADPIITGPSCPPGYDGPTNLATGCPYWMMSYTVQYPGLPSWRCPAYSSPPLALQGADGAAGAGSVERVVDGCAGVATAN